MKKYNLSEIMKRAWSLARKFKTTISVGLKRAWAEAKAPELVISLSGSEKQIAWAQDIINTAINTCTNNIKKSVDEENRTGYVGFFVNKIESLITCREQIMNMFKSIDGCHASKIIDLRDRISSGEVIKIANMMENRLGKKELR